MKTCLLITFLIALTSIGVWAQKNGKILFREDFDDNKNNWFLQTKKWKAAAFRIEKTANIQKGYYWITSRKKDTFGVSPFIIKKKNSKNYTIETAIKITLADTADFVTLQWQDGNQKYGIKLNNTGGYLLLSNLGKYYYHFKSGQLPFQFISKKALVLKVEVKGSYCYYYINNHLIYSFFSLDKPITQDSSILGKFEFELTNSFFYSSQSDIVGAAIDYLEVRENNAATTLAVHDTLYQGMTLEYYIKTHKEEVVEESYLNQYQIRKTVSNTPYPILEGDSIRLIKKVLPTRYDTVDMNFVKNWKLYNKKEVAIVNVDNYRAITYLDENNAYQVVDNIPNLIAITKDSFWQFDNNYGEFSELKLTVKGKTTSIAIKKVGRLVLEDISPDRKSLVFKKRRVGDIYISHWNKAKRAYNKPIQTNLNGEQVRFGLNSKTLYLSSYAYDRIGQYHKDLFVSNCLNEDKNQWSTPQNLGLNINTVNNENLLYVSKRGLIVSIEKKFYEVTWEQ